MAEPVIRRATEGDVATLSRLRREFTLEDRPIPSPREDFDAAFEEIVATGLNDGRWTVWVADVDGEIVSHAFIGLVDKIPRPTPEQRWIGYLTNVYTRPAFRSLGLGGLVLESVKTWASEEDVELLIVWPSERSVGFYRRHGFVGDAEPLVWMSPNASG
ncbi:MAG: GNAT family N-acetyltransferase [Actinobacteria bacterium]|nr:GNAT family N-acetyltransferase [Actinomycetota bacterium]MDQ3424950.1 GNAT family N-acetyltransferase [Actinomycetota bacterium]